jgi:hypothetical protein
VVDRPLTRHWHALPQPSYPRPKRRLHLHGCELGARPSGRRLRLQPGTDRNGIRPCDCEPGLVLGRGRRPNRLLVRIDYSRRRRDGKHHAPRRSIEHRAIDHRQRVPNALGAFDRGCDDYVPRPFAASRVVTKSSPRRPAGTFGDVLQLRGTWPRRYRPVANGGTERPTRARQTSSFESTSHH